jgi:hypothetical protein
LVRPVDLTVPRLSITQHPDGLMGFAAGHRQSAIRTCRLVLASGSLAFMARVFTRSEFHQLVWSKPMTHLAKEFGLSDVALHKICRKHDIPNPPLGWWAKKAAGKLVSEIPLPTASGNVSDRIVVSAGELRSEPDDVMTVREEARIRASSPVDDAPTNAIVRRTAGALRKAKANEKGLLSTFADAGLIDCEITAASIDRAETVLTAIAAAAMQQGFELNAVERAVKFVRQDEAIGFSLTETVKRVKHEPTEKETAALEKWQRKRARERYSNPWGASWSDRPQIPEWEWHSTGQLSFEFENVYGPGPSPRKTFRDAKLQRLETLAADIGVGLAVLAAVKKEGRRLHEERERERQEEQRVRELAQRLAHVEERRVDALATILKEAEALDRLRRILRDVRATASGNNDSRVTEFLRWIDGHLAAQEKALTAEGLAARFEEKRLFGDDDDYGFRAPCSYL